jgi:23S rRNA (adenine2503-C2)-methyltransferase
MNSFHDLTFAQLQARLVSDGLSATHTAPLWRALYRDLAPDLLAPDKFLPPLQRWLQTQLSPAGDFFLEEPVVKMATTSSDGLTQKFLLRLQDGQTIETVLMGYPGRHTACVSTQAGCAMGCVFCATGQMGFVRHLRPGEIVAQVLHVQRVLRERGEKGLRNLVLMGMGEPLHNYEAVMTALEIISETRGFNIGPGRITISTVGVVPGLLRLAEEQRPYNLAVSLHGTTDAERGALVPINQRWPLAELIDACRIYGQSTGRRIFFEWTLIAGVNDSTAQAEQLGQLLQGLDAHVNLIPLNPTQGFHGLATGLKAAGAFQRILRTAGFPSTVRQRRGIDVAAGCGQLASARE